MCRMYRWEGADCSYEKTWHFNLCRHCQRCHHYLGDGGDRNTKRGHYVSVCRLIIALSEMIDIEVVVAECETSIIGDI